MKKKDLEQFMGMLRPSKDQVVNAIDLLKECCEMNNLTSDVYINAMVNIILRSYVRSEVPMSDFLIEMEENYQKMIDNWKDIKKNGN